MSYQAVFFDAGETLVHPHPTFPDLFSQILGREGHHVAPELIRDKIGIVSERFAQAARENELWTTSPVKSRAIWHDVYEIFNYWKSHDFRDLSDGLIDVVYGEFTDLANYRVFEDVPPVLDRLVRGGLTLGVISNFEEWLERLLDALEVGRFFPVRVISGMEGVEKPDPRIFDLALERAGVEAAESAYVGDSPVFDVAPAAAVGMFPVLIDRRDRFPDAQGARITSMAELPGVLGL